jgi:hypothetical protein
VIVVSILINSEYVEVKTHGQMLPGSACSAPLPRLESSTMHDHRGALTPRIAA